VAQAVRENTSQTASGLIRTQPKLVNAGEGAREDSLQIGTGAADRLRRTSGTSQNFAKNLQITVARMGAGLEGIL